MRVIVCGGRDFAHRPLLDFTLDTLRHRYGVDELAHGGASGADRLAGEWAASRGVPMRVFAADWRGDGRSAGPRRNQRMLERFKPDAVIAFPGGRGTADMVRRARQAGVPVTRVHVGEERLACP